MSELGMIDANNNKKFLAERENIKTERSLALRRVNREDKVKELNKQDYNNYTQQQLNILEPSRFFF